MKRIWWLASYPKSGNTWLRVLLTNYLNNTASDINRLMGRSLTSRHPFDDWLGLESSDLRADEIENFRHDYHLHIGKTVQAPVFVKTHDAFIRTGEGKRLFPEASTMGAVYLVRNPLDVAISYAHHENRSVDEMITAMSDPDRYLLDHEYRLRRNLPQKLSSWSLHVKSWQECRNLKTVRYEDLSASPKDVFREILIHLDIPADERKIETAVANASFHKLQAQERIFGFKERHPPAPSFFRAGKAGEWQKILSQGQIHRIISDHKNMMTCFNYL